MYTKKEKNTKGVGVGAGSEPAPTPAPTPGRTELSELGEFGLIDHLSKNIIPKHSGTLKGIGDDAAPIDVDRDTEVTLDA